MFDVGETERVVGAYKDMIAHIALHYLQSWPDAEDVTQDVFIKWATKGKTFADEDHEKAWFIRVTVNLCKDQLRSARRKHTVLRDDLPPVSRQSDDASHSLLREVLSLPPDYRLVIYLHYYEGYTLREIAGYLHKSENTIQTRHQRAKELLKSSMGETHDGLETLHR